jgi:hypothetical protein
MNPWATTPSVQQSGSAAGGSATFILATDLQGVKAHNAAKGRKDEHRIHMHMAPEPRLGCIDAPVVFLMSVCMMNGGSPDCVHFTSMAVAVRSKSKGRFARSTYFLTVPNDFRGHSRSFRLDGIHANWSSEPFYDMHTLCWCVAGRNGLTSCLSLMVMTG